ncbi:SsrA-binding protein SmpB [Thermodesulfobacteriota bacterium]
MAVKTVCQNRKARHNYQIGESIEAGIVLTGSEIKSIRAGRANLKDSYARVHKGEVILYDSHISAYEFANRQNHEPLRPRKLLLHKSEIRRLYAKTREQGFSLIPLRIYLKDGRAKVEIAFAKGKRKYEKREDLKKHEARREIERALRRK